VTDLLSVMAADLTALFELGGLTIPVTYVPAAEPDADPDAEPPAPVELVGMFDEAYQEVDPHSRMPIGSTGPAVHLRSADLPAYPAEADRLVIRGRTFRIVLPKPDGEGVTIFILQEETS
jgi:hypothetical protein